MRVLFTTPILEHPAAGGPQLRIENSIKALAKVCELDIASRALQSPESCEGTSLFYRAYSREYQVLPRLLRGREKNRLLSLPEKVLNRLFDTRIASDASWLVAYTEREKIDVLWCGYGNISYPLIKRIKAARPGLKIVCDTDSVWSRFILRELPYASDSRKKRIAREGIRKEAEERALVNLADVTTAVSAVDFQYYHDIASDVSRIQLFSNVIDLESYKTPPGAPPGFRNPSVYLAGSFGDRFSPMNTAARWILEEVLPVLRRTHPSVHFYIVGRNSQAEFGHLNGHNITVTGRLDSVLPYLCNSDVALVPLMFESGTRFKILEAGACKIPLVSTTLGAEGIPVRDGEHILIADTPQEFSSAIARILDDRKLGATLALNCHNLVRQHFSIEALAKEGAAILEYLSHV